MVLTPLDIRQKEFTKKMRGADPEEVKNFLEKVSEETETLLGENADIRKELTMLKDKLAGYIQLEETIRNTLLMAQKAADEAVTNARKQAELIIEESRNRGRDIEKEYSNLKSAKRQFVIEFETMLDTFKRHLKEFGEESNGNGGGEPGY